jgi:hypothetical protein
VRVRSLLETYENSVWFYAPDICFADARRYIPSISAKRRIDPAPGIVVLDHLSRMVGNVSVWPNPPTAVILTTNGRKNPKRCMPELKSLGFFTTLRSVQNDDSLFRQAY